MPRHAHFDTRSLFGRRCKQGLTRLLPADEPPHQVAVAPPAQYQATGRTKPQRVGSLVQSTVLVAKLDDGC